MSTFPQNIKLFLRQWITCWCPCVSRPGWMVPPPLVSLSEPEWGRVGRSETPWAEAPSVQLCTPVGSGSRAPGWGSCWRGPDTQSGGRRRPVRCRRLYWRAPCRTLLTPPTRWEPGWAASRWKRTEPRWWRSGWPWSGGGGVPSRSLTSRFRFHSPHCQRCVGSGWTSGAGGSTHWW